MNASPSPLAELGHELRTPLTAILGYADAVRGAAFGPLDEKYVEAAEAIHLAGRHLLAMVNAMTDIGRIERGVAPFDLEVFDIVETVRAAVSLLKDEADRLAITLTAPPAGQRILVSADRAAVTRIVINLLGNALKFTPTAGRVSVDVARDGPDIRLTVTDTGPGLSAGVSATGEGLGLILVRALCALHGGALEFAVAPGGGTVATARLPIAERS